MHEPERTPDGDLPERNPLQVARELGLTKLGVRLQRRARRQLVGDDPRGLQGPVERAVHDVSQPCVSKLRSHRGGLRPAKRAEVKAVEMAVEHPVRVFDLRVPDQKKPRVRCLVSGAPCIFAA